MRNPGGDPGGNPGRIPWETSGGNPWDTLREILGNILGEILGESWPGFGQARFLVLGSGFLFLVFQTLPMLLVGFEVASSKFLDQSSKFQGRLSRPRHFLYWVGGGGGPMLDPIFLDHVAK